MITEMFRTEKEIEEFLNQCDVKHYRIHQDLSVSIFDECLNISHQNIELIPFRIQKLKVLNVNYTNIKRFGFDILPEGLEAIHANSSQLRYTFGIPSTVIYIDIDWTDVKKFDSLPKSLKVIRAYGTYIDSTEGLPPTTLLLDDGQISLRETFIKELEYKLKENEFFEKEYDFPKSAKDVPSSLKNLNISKTKIEVFEDLPERLEDTLAYYIPLKSTKGLPSNCQIYA